MRNWPEAHRFVALILCLSLLLPMAPVPAKAAGAETPGAQTGTPTPEATPASANAPQEAIAHGCPQAPAAAKQSKQSGKKPRFPEYVEVTIGQPSVWSLGQAHYLLANLHERDRELSTKMPNPDDLDPNRVNSAQLETLRTLFQFEGQFDQPLGTKNNLDIQRFNESRNIQKQAQGSLPDRRADLAETTRELGLLSEELAVLKEQDRQSTEARAATKPPTPPSKEDNERKLRIAVLTARVDEKTAEKTRLESEVKSLEATAGTAVNAPDIKGPELTSGRANLPASPAFDAFVNKALNNFNQPSLAASTALDNFVGMQYEIIAKQLTLLRDEVGPDERVIFLELPASIYTVDKWADGYVAQVEWTVTKYYDKEPSDQDRACAICASLPKDFQSYYTTIQSTLPMKERRQEWSAEKLDELQTMVSKAELSAYQLDECLHLYPKTLLKPRPGEVTDNDLPYPVTLDMIQMASSADSNNNAEASMGLATRLKVRALDIIPRQSALNVNENHATVKNVGILGFLKWLSGVGAKLDFERQREVYEQFIYQDIFASGFGKGKPTFGWTFGPLPGSQRLAPGQRTTYAVLAVPRNTLALELTAKSKVFKRFQNPPEKEDPDFRVIVSVPGPKTDAFVIDRINYTPVLKGGRNTVVMRGNFLSPQLGVMINGIPLRKVVSLARTGSKEEPPAVSGPGIQGEFEITNTHQMVLSFSMGSDFVGTPLITMVTPEKSVTLNYTRMIINNRYLRPMPLQAVSSFEPMFIDGFSVEKDIKKHGEAITLKENGKDVKYVIFRLEGKGLRHDSDVYVNNKELGKFPIRFPSHKEIENVEVLFKKRAEVAEKNDPKETKEFEEGLPPEIKEFLVKDRNDSFAVQESTGVYVLFLKDPGDDWSIRYRQRTRQGFEESSFEKSFAKPPVTHEILHYRKGPAEGPAELFLTVTSNVEQPIDKVEMIEPMPMTGNPCSFQDDGGKKKHRVKCLVARDSGKERDFVTLKASFKTPESPKPSMGSLAAPFSDQATQEKGVQEPVFLDISLPLQPVIAAVINPSTGTASGLAVQPAFVIIKGDHLENIKAVFFGDQAGIDLAVSPGGLTVKVPKLDGVPKGQSVAVPVLFQTKGDGEAKIPSGAFYTYLGEPLSQQVIVWPYPPGTQPGTYPAATPEPKKP